MRKGLGCGAVGDTRVDLARVQPQMVQVEHEGLHTAITPHFVD